jgi:methylmalonyl-CoA mutase N-terminal domain/subunit
VNRYSTGGGEAIPVLEVDPALEEEQRRRLSGWRAGRDELVVESALGDLQDQAEGESNLLTPMKVALRHGATVGEVSNRLRAVFGVYRPA